VSIPLYIFFLIALYLSPRTIPPSWLTFKTLFLILLVPLVARSYSAQLDLLLLLHLEIYTLPALVVLSQSTPYWWSVLPIEVSVLSTVAAVWTSSNRLPEKWSPHFWAIIVAVTFIPLLVSKIVEPFVSSKWVSFISPVTYIISPLGGNLAPALYGAFFVWIPTLFLLVLKRRTVCVIGK